MLRKINSWTPWTDNFRENKVLIFHVNCLPADNSHEISSLINFLTDVTKYTSAAFLVEDLRVNKRTTFLHFPSS